MPTFRIIIIGALIMWMEGCTNSFAQDSIPGSIRLMSRFDLSYVVGGQIYNDSFIYKPGFSVSGTGSVVLNDYLTAGLGLGFLSLKDDKFLPVYLEISGFRKNIDNPPMIKVQAGYSIGWSTEENNLSDYDFNGGVYFNAGIGRKIRINSSYAMLFHLSYAHQFARVEYQVFDGNEYSRQINYDMIMFSLGFIINKP